MPKFFIAYTGGTHDDPETMEENRAAFGAWLAEAGDAVIDPGAPLHTVARLAEGEPADEMEILGFSIIEVDDIETAQELLSGHPFIRRGGTVQISEFVTLAS